MTPTPTLLSWSGGKDSTLALAALRADPAVQAIGLLTSVTRDYDRISIHGVRRALLEAQARSLGLPLFEVTLEAASTNASYERAFHAGLAAVRAERPDLATVAFGDLYLTDVRAYRERLLAGTGIGASFPLWNRPTHALARDFVDAGYVAHIVCVDTTQLDASFAGCVYDHALLASLPSSVDPCGENGEFHTFVSAGPGFASSLGVTVGECVLREARFMYADLLSS